MLLFLYKLNHFIQKKKLHVYYHSYNTYSVEHHQIFFIMTLFPQLYSSFDDFQQKGGHVRRNIVTQDEDSNNRISSDQYRIPIEIRPNSTKIL
jgi:hypothetical protein